jgi:CubicO group peptidase (beta-lactamase class C family)
VNTPGEAYSYTTHGYILASAVVERAAEKPYVRVVRDRVCRPLRLRSLQPDYQFMRIRDRAVGYRRDSNGAIKQSSDTDVSWKVGGGGWISTIDDLAGFAEGLLSDEFLDEELRRTLWTEQRTLGGRATGYGLGFGLGKSGEERRVSHTGAQEKARTILVLYPDSNRGIVVMSNSEWANPTELAQVIESAVSSWDAGSGR